MKEPEKQKYQEQYKKEKEKGVFFFPDIIIKDAVVSLVVFLVLVALAYFVGAKLEPRANPADTTYTPRPEWYFLFLFQFLKYFPGNLEVIGVLVIPAIIIGGLFVLPFIDRSQFRYFTNRPIVVTVVALVVVGIGTLTILAATEAPPPQVAATSGDQTAVLYAKNCAGCHGTKIDVPQGTDLHSIIAKGTHGGMPGWSADLSSDQIDALAGFILAPQGSKLFTDQCGKCHPTADTVVGNAIELNKVLTQGPQYAKHAGQAVPDWTKTLTDSERIALLNFLVAPDGARLFDVNCSSCHGYSLAVTQTKEELTDLISKGGLHVQMPAWKTQFDQSQRELLAHYVMDPAANPNGKDLYTQKCATCHGGQIPRPASYEAALDAITNGSAHTRSMPIWGQILTPQQLSALVDYIISSSQGPSTAQGQKLFAANCSACHGDLGQGGPNPALPGDIIPPITSSEYLKTHNDQNIQTVISMGESSIGMPPFGSSNGGQLDDDAITAIVAFLRSWENNPPAEGLVTLPTPTRTVVPPTQTPAPATSTPEPTKPGETPEPTSSAPEPTATATATVKAAVPSFKTDVMPIIEKNCGVCHGAMGGWKTDSYSNVINSGDSGPAVIPGDIEKSPLAQWIRGLRADGKLMPPGGKMDDSLIQIILDWITGGAPDN